MLPMTWIFKWLFAWLLLGGLCAWGMERPNILWITSEDNAAHWLGCYGNAEAATPRLDALAATGLRFSHAYANGPVCAVARSTLLLGAHAVTMGTQHMRSRHPIPAAYRAHVTHLRGLGYYCTNQVKTDYNFRGNDAALWDVCSTKAHYRNRPAGRPFFAVFNLNITHESQLFPDNVAANRKSGAIPAVPRLDPAALTLPPHWPDLPELRGDCAIYHDCVSAMDRKVGVLLDELAREGLAEETIVFYFSDHGGAMARGKRFLHDTGVRVPLIIHVPEKWRALSPFAPGSVVDERVSFVDFAPTLLSLCGVAIPPPMQGRAFLGEHRSAPAADARVFLYADRFDLTEGMRRGLTDGHYKYIRCFSPHLAGAPYSAYALGQPSWSAWRDAAAAGELPEVHAAMWKSPQPVEMLFDLSRDPWEIENLAARPEHAVRLAAFREQLRATMLATRDTGVVPEPLWKDLVENGPIHDSDAVRGDPLRFNRALGLAFAASAGDPVHFKALQSALHAVDPVQRYWAATGCLILGQRAAAAQKELTDCLEDPYPLIRIVAAEALIATGAREAGEAALRALQERKLPAETGQWLTNALARHLRREKVEKAGRE